MKTDQTDADTSTVARNLLSVTGSHRHTLEAIFHHPSAHNLEWRQVVGLIAEIGDAHERGNGEFVFEVAGTRHIMRKPHSKDLTSSEVSSFGISSRKRGFPRSIRLSLPSIPNRLRQVS